MGVSRNEDEPIANPSLPTQAGQRLSPANLLGNTATMPRAGRRFRGGLLGSFILHTTSGIRQAVFLHLPPTTVPIKCYETSCLGRTLTADHCSRLVSALRLFASSVFSPFSEAVVRTRTTGGRRERCNSGPSFVQPSENLVIR